MAELITDERRVGDHIRELQGTVDAIAEAHLSALESHMEATADRLGTRAVDLRMTDLERRADRIVPRQTALVTRDGYTRWREHLSAVGEEVRDRYPYEGIASTSELQLLIDGNHTALDIKKMLDAQNRITSDLQAILNYLEILRAAGLIEM